MIQWVVKLVMQAATSFRGASAVLAVFQLWLPGLERIPAPNTGQRWLLRLGGKGTVAPQNEGKTAKRFLTPFPPF